MPADIYVFAFHGNNNPFSPLQEGAAIVYTFWDSRATPEDMEEMWNNPHVLKEWNKSGEKKGNVRFSHDLKKRLYVSRVELKVKINKIFMHHKNSHFLFWFTIYFYIQPIFVGELLLFSIQMCSDLKPFATNNS